MPNLKGFNTLQDWKKEGVSAADIVGILEVIETTRSVFPKSDAYITRNKEKGDPILRIGCWAPSVQGRKVFLSFGYTNEREVCVSSGSDSRKPTSKMAEATKSLSLFNYKNKKFKVQKIK